MTYKVHPAIGVARVGNSPEHYLAPERPGGLPLLPDGRPFTPADFRDAEGRMRRQGARFTVFRYDEGGEGAEGGGPGVPVEPGRDGVARIEWTVHVANKKAVWYEFFVNAGQDGYAPDHPLRNAAVTDPAERVKLIVDPGPRTLTGPGQSAEFSRDADAGGYPVTFPPEGLRPRPVDSLGGALTDDAGRLVVLGGYGSAGSTVDPPFIVDYANNDDWWDDTSDGPVTARVVMDDGTAVEVDAPAWVVVGPPRYAPELVNLVTLWDTMFDVAVRSMGARPDIYRDSLWNGEFRPSWERDVLPVLERAHRYQWVVAIPPHPHAFEVDKLGDPSPDYDALRGYYLSLVRPPDAPNQFTAPDSGLPMMPYLAGDNCFEPGPMASNYLTVTQTQWFFLRQWAAGKFTVGEPAQEPPGAALDRAALENCVGGAFSPGIEVTWVSRNPLLYTEPFRVRHKPDVRPPLGLGQDLAAGLEPGDLCKYMALPWQADFNECCKQPIGDRVLWWWPVQRPNFVYVHAGERLLQVPWVGTDKDQNAADYVQFADDIEMVRRWNELGFVVDEGTDRHPRFVEVERLIPRRRGD